jgi:hypothetical protein
MQSATVTIGVKDGFERDVGERVGKRARSSQDKGSIVI